MMKLKEANVEDLYYLRKQVLNLQRKGRSLLKIVRAIYELTVKERSLEEVA